MSPAGAVLHSSTFAGADFATITDAIAAYLGQASSLPRPRIGCLATPAPVSGDQIRMTNHPWSFSLAALRGQLGFERLEIINDFTAVALALPRLGPDDRMPMGGGMPIHCRQDGVFGAVLGSG